LKWFLYFFTKSEYTTSIKGTRMLRKDKPFPGMLTDMKDDTRRIEDSDERQSFRIFKIKHKAEGEYQPFLESYERELQAQNTFKPISLTPIELDVIGFNVADYTKCMFDVKIDEAPSFPAKLLRIDAKGTYKDGNLTFVYTLKFEKDIDPELDALLTVEYLDAETRDARDRRVKEEFPIQLTVRDITKSNGTNLL
jgi:hypothetical protein